MLPLAQGKQLEPPTSKHKTIFWSNNKECLWSQEISSAGRFIL